MGWRAATGLPHQKWRPYRVCTNWVARRIGHFAVHEIVQLGACFFGFRVGFRALSHFSAGADRVNTQKSLPPSLHYAREMGKNIWPAGCIYPGRSDVALALCMERQLDLLSTPLATWACSQGVHSLNLGTFQCFTWFKTKNLVEVHCFRWKIPSNQKLFSQTPYWFLWLVVLHRPVMDILWSFIKAKLDKILTRSVNSKFSQKVISVKSALTC